MTVRVRFTEFVKDSEDLENSNLFVFVHIKFEMFEFVWEGKKTWLRDFKFGM